ncbi:hypothetical protein QJS04_geneDACA014714 [Acorus gramineus]|uniref:Uncharacterized protein n=1 Tax=Acorus gramineus TaxID=55184 RepID=A0AAV9B3N7_ACOGR|nr:hypothetical protein QJS04_geneDACA014714 [Acorus gramineus]
MQIMKTAEKEVTAIKERIAKDRGMQETTPSTSQVTTNASEDFPTLDPTKLSTEGRKRTVRPSTPLEEKGRAKNIRACSRCKETGHNIHTCKKVLTGVSDQPMNTIEGSLADPQQTEVASEAENMLN